MKHNLLLFIGLNIVLYTWISWFHTAVPFHKENYEKNFHHFLADPRAAGGQFSLLRALGQSDAQWYLKIASDGYSSHPGKIDLNDKHTMEGLTYAFFPLYPILIAGVNIAANNIELAAFIVSNLLMIANFVSLAFLGFKLFSRSTTYKAIFLLFAFPFSIFYRSYFTEGLLLFTLIWFCWFVIQKHWIRAAMALGLMNIVKSNGFLLNGYLLYLLWREYKHHRISKKALVTNVTVLALPFFLWMAFCFVKTGNPVYFATVRSEWNSYMFPLMNLNINGFLVLLFPFMPFHGFHYSKIDTLTMIGVFFLLIKSRKVIDQRLWWIAVCLWLTPLLTTDLMSFTRYQTTSFPLFFYAAQQLSPRQYGIIFVGSAILLSFVGLLFVNWYWIG